MQTVPRLYELFEPNYYLLTLNLTQAHQRTFSGSVEINGTAKSDGEIKLHAKDLDISKIWIDAESVQFTTAQDIITLSSKQISKGAELRITIDFGGKITDSMHGLYPCYFEHEGKKKELFATQFESHHAREVFPCVDEPEAKATFDLTVITKDGENVLSNMPKTVGHLDENGAVEHIFDTTPRMSTYLLALVVGELQKKSAQTKDGTEVNVWATHAQPANSLDFALDVAVRSIEFFNDYFGVPYPLPKADHVALPDFSSGAMENWGLITYREICMLADQHTSVSVRQYVATVIAHETSHQWFGNLVTMKWWDDLWLNESFATLMEYVCVDSLFPAWNIWMTFATNETLSAMRRDYLPGVQSVKTPVNHPDEISTLFDPSIVYAKGARLLAMLRDYIGDEAFRNGLAGYFREHPYKNTTGDDLWAALSGVSEHDVKAFMTPWLEQSGLPVVHVSKQDEGHYKLTQEHFVIGEQSDTSRLWPIPLNANVDETSIPALLDSHDLLAPLTDNLQINCGGRGHFITHYADTTLFSTRVSAIKSQKQPDPADRLTLLHDASLLARAGLTKASDLYDLSNAYSLETSEPVWDIISLVINDVKRFVETDIDAEIALKKNIVNLAHPSFEKLGWDVIEGEQETDTKLRATIIGLLTYADDPTVIARGLKDFHECSDLATLPGEIRSLIFAITAKHGTPDDIERLITTHEQTNSSELQGDISAGLCATKDPILIDRLIGLLKNESIVRLQDVDRWFIYLMRNRHGREKMWNWMVENWQWIVDTFAGDKSYDNFVRYSASALSAKQWQERYRDFFWPKRDVPALKRAIELGLSDITARAQWLERDQAELLAHLKAEG